MTTFKVGDQVEHRTFGAGKIAFGPYLRDGSPDNYLMQQVDGEHRFVESEAMQLAAKFKIGDKVSSYGDEYTLKAGPFIGHSAPWYVVTADGVDYRAGEGTLSLIDEATQEIKVGDKVRVLIDNADGASVSKGDIFTVKSVYSGEIVTDMRSRRGSWFFQPANVERVDEPPVTADTYTYDGVTYDLAAKYRDSDGDYWTFKRVDGVVRGYYASTADRDVTHLIDEYSDTLADVVRDYNGLTRVSN